MGGDDHVHRVDPGRLGPRGEVLEEGLVRDVRPGRKRRERSIRGLMLLSRESRLLLELKLTGRMKLRRAAGVPYVPLTRNSW